jgi:hypothetical protein
MKGERNEDHNETVGGRSPNGQGMLSGFCAHSCAKKGKTAMNANGNGRRGMNSAAGTIADSEKTEVAPVVSHENHKECQPNQSVSITARILDGTICEYLADCGHLPPGCEIVQEMWLLNTDRIAGLPTPFPRFF